LIKGLPHEEHITVTWSFNFGLCSTTQHFANSRGVMTLPDFRIRLPAPKIDFISEVGLTNTDADNYPAYGSQARADWMRLYLIGLLTQQTSYEEPTIFADGTPWFDLNDGTLKIRLNDAWVPYSEVISVEHDPYGISTKTLAEFYNEVSETLVSLAPEIVFTGTSNTNSVSSITIPVTLRGNLNADSRAFVYVNGLLKSPLSTQLNQPNPTMVILTGFTINSGDTFTVIIRRIPDSTYYAEQVVL